MSKPPARGHLPRLAPEHYRGFAFVHWVLTVDERATGWLTDGFHAAWREAMLHALVRYDLLCPAYCLMPDHAHVIWMGCSPTADQKLSATFFRRITNPLLAPHCWQLQSFDHVLREDERKRGAFQSVCQYVRQNPVRKQLAEHADDFAFSGAMIPGYPDLVPKRQDFWETFWRVYNRRVEASIPAP
jgi:putative transposase